MNALEKSVLKWEKKLIIVQQNLGEPFNRIHHLFGMTGCPLCKLYYDIENECERCPICKKTELEYCMGSPYEEIRDYFLYADSKLDKNLVSIIKKEIRFLKELTKNQLNNKERKQTNAKKIR